MKIDLGELISHKDTDYSIKRNLINKVKYEDGFLKKIIDYLDAGYRFSSVSNVKKCEFCDEIAGTSTYYSDGKWIWAKWLTHYITKHNLELRKEFLDHINDVGYEGVVIRLV